MSLIPCEMDEANADLPLEAPKWFAVYTNVKCEKRAALSIMDALRPRDRWHDLAVYLPCETYWASHARKEERKTRPLFMRYLFVCIRPADMHTIRACDGVADFVRAGTMPAVISPIMVDSLRCAEEAGAFDPTREELYAEVFKAGDQIKIAKGNWADWPGTVIRMSAADRVVVLLKAFGREHEKEVAVDQLKAA